MLVVIKQLTSSSVWWEVFNIQLRTCASNSIIQVLQRGAKAENMGEGLSREGPTWSSLQTYFHFDRFETSDRAIRFCQAQSCKKMPTLYLVAQPCPTLCDPMDCSPPGSSAHGDSPGETTGVGCHAFLHGIFPTQVSNPGLPHCRQIDSLLSEPPWKPEKMPGSK